jgi:chloramphenicol 3-O phosphotransferase
MTAPMTRDSGPAGQIIFLNGASSSGKTSIARELLLVLDRPYFHMSVDAINGMRARQRTLELSPAGLDVVFVGVHCSAAELDRRERDRGDRDPGQAAGHAGQVHAHGSYDIECDTTAASPRDCAMAIKDFLTRRTGPSAFDRLRQLCR